MTAPVATLSRMGSLVVATKVARGRSQRCGRDSGGFRSVHGRPVGSDGIAANLLQTTARVSSDGRITSSRFSVSNDRDRHGRTLIQARPLALEGGDKGDTPPVTFKLYTLDSE